MNTVWFRFFAAGVGGAVVLGVAAPAFADDWPPESAIPPEKGMVMVTVRGGCFTMGDFVGEGEDNEKPTHRVCVHDFKIGKYPVTQTEWIQVMGHNPSAYDSCGVGYCPVENVSWNDAQEFIRRINQRGAPKYRLPTEAEWEYAARSGGKDEQWAGTNDPKKLVDYAWFGANANYQTHRVGEKKPNGIGLYDMTGNVWEWMSDWYAPDYYARSPEHDPQGPASGTQRVLRGGFWGSLDDMARTTRRVGLAPTTRSPGYGFRVVQTQP
jgi:formylglycine-generating enzyme required for sulfatase activity